MTRKEKLISLLQPKHYISKLKLYCKDCEFKVIKLEKEDKREKRIKITEI